MNKSKKAIIIILILAAVIWCGIIFFFSAQSGVQSTGVSNFIITKAAEIFSPDSNPEELIAKYSFIVRKGAHFAIYTVLSSILMVVMNIAREKMSLPKKYIAAVSITVFFAFTDEFHQFFTEGRSAQLSDVLIDSCGALTGAAFVSLILYIRKRSKNKK